MDKTRRQLEEDTYPRFEAERHKEETAATQSVGVFGRLWGFLGVCGGFWVSMGVFGCGGFLGYFWVFVLC